MALVWLFGSIAAVMVFCLWIESKRGRRSRRRRRK